MQVFDLTVDFNGIVIFEPTRLRAFLGGSVPPGTNLWQRFSTSDDGDEVVRQGIVIPILGINDGFYRVVVRSGHEDSPVVEPILFENGVFPLFVERRLVLADMAVLLEWEDDLGWNDLTVSSGFYEVTIRGFRKVEKGRIVRCGYEIVMAETESMPHLSGSLEADMQVLTLER